MKIEVMPGQSIWDLAIQAGGSIEYVRELMSQNPEKITSLNTAVKAGDVLLAGDVPIDREVQEYLAQLGVKPAKLDVPFFVQDGDEPVTFGDFNEDFNTDFYT